MGMMSEFKAFALRGNVVDMAVGVVIGGAFGVIISSMVSDILMPIVGLATGGVNFKDQYVALNGPHMHTMEEAKAAGVATLNYGNLIDASIKFVIIAFALFVIIKAINQMQRREAAKPAAPPAPTMDQVLLTEIRDLLKRGAKA